MLTTHLSPARPRCPLRPRLQHSEAYRAANIDPALAFGLAFFSTRARDYVPRGRSRPRAWPSQPTRSESAWCEKGRTCNITENRRRDPQLGFLSHCRKGRRQRPADARRSEHCSLLFRGPTGTYGHRKRSSTMMQPLRPSSGTTPCPERKRSPIHDWCLHICLAVCEEVRGWRLNELHPLDWCMWSVCETTTVPLATVPPDYLCGFERFVRR